ncbi:MAG: hypothetical protein KC441_19675, partial [Anaerolineales bacterium]|nr:hypothetical protein [Anaerolineales bacterium]
MTVFSVSVSRRLLVLVLLLLGVTLFSFSMFSPAAAEPGAVSSEVNATPFFSLNGTINPHAAIAPTYFQSSGSRAANFSFTLSSGNAPVAVEIRNAANAVLWSNDVQVGETVWGSVTLTSGVNTFTLSNDGSLAAGFSLKFFDLPAAPYSWVGTASPAGVNSQARLIFPQSGLYTFNFGVNANGRYEFTVDDTYIQKTVTAADSAVYFVPAGAHHLGIVQNPSGGFVNWHVAVSYTGTAVNSLPYSQSSAQINEEWLPVYLAAPAEVNMVVTAAGDPGHSLLVEVNQVAKDAGIAQSNASQVVQTGETGWLTFDLPAGLSFIHLTAAGGLVSYDLTIDALPQADYTWAGAANPSGANSKARLQFATAGLYKFDFSMNGRFQFILQVDGQSYLQKTVESFGDSVVYYVPAGTHLLTLDQDSAAGADWTVAISLQSAGPDSLPFANSGGLIGGTGNDFSQEWLPLSLAGAATVNLSLDVAGAAADDLVLAVYQAGSSTPDFVAPAVRGGEKTWFTFDLSAGVNRLHLQTGSNTAPLSYDMEVRAVPGAAAASWSGSSLAAGANSVVTVDFPTAGLYQFSLNAADGFARLVLDDALAGKIIQATSETTYDVMVTAGPHEVYVLQDPAYPATDWSAAVRSATAGESFFVFDGELAPGESVTPQYTVPQGSLDFNFALAVSGAPVGLTLRDGGGGVIWDDSALDGETVWGTGALSGTSTIALSNQGTAPVTISLVFYHLPTAAYTWDGLAAPAGAESHIRLIFPQDGLYTFDAGVDNGRYQFLLSAARRTHLQKTAENSTSVTYFVPAGLHDLYLAQDTTAGADWDVAVSAVGAADDMLPYEKAGGELGGTGNDFTEEWLPIHLGHVMPVNLSLAVQGSAADGLQAAVLDSSGTVLHSLPVQGQEIIWRTLDLPADAWVHLTAVGNTGPLSYELAFQAVPEPAAAWAGHSAAAGAASHFRLDFPAGGLYTFDLGQNAGRYQMLLDEQFIQKTVESSTAVTYFVPAGVHDIRIAQDSAAGADWEVAVSGPAADADTLPYQKAGGELGGSGNDFTEEWLPLHTGADQLVNL